MGMYTEIFVNVDLKENTPKEVIEVLKAMCDKDHESPHLLGRPQRWAFLFNDSSFYLPCTECGVLTYNNIRKAYSLIAKGDIKNSSGEIEEFFEFIKPWCEDEFIGYTRYEEDREPTLIYSR